MTFRIVVLIAALTLGQTALAQDKERLASIKAVHAEVQAAIKNKKLKVERLGFKITVPAVGPQDRSYKMHIAPNGVLRKLTVAFHVAASAEVKESFWFDKTGALVFHYARVDAEENCAKGEPPVEAITERRHFIAAGKIIQVKLDMRGGKTTPGECDQWFRGKSKLRPAEARDDKPAQRLVRAGEGYVKAAAHLHKKGPTAPVIALIKEGEK